MKTGQQVIEELIDNANFIFTQHYRGGQSSDLFIFKSESHFDNNKSLNDKTGNACVNKDIELIARFADSKNKRIIKIVK